MCTIFFYFFSIHIFNTHHFQFSLFSSFSATDPPLPYVSIALMLTIYIYIYIYMYVYRINVSISLCMIKISIVFNNYLFICNILLYFHYRKVLGLLFLLEGFYFSEDCSTIYSHLRIKSSCFEYFVSITVRYFRTYTVSYIY